MNNVWSKVAYGNPSDGISGRDWGNVLNDVVRALIRATHFANEKLAEHGDSVTHYTINNVVMDAYAIINTGEISPMPPILQPPIFQFGFATASGMTITSECDFQWLVSQVYAPSHYDTREPEDIMADVLLEIFDDEYQEVYT